MSSDLAAIQAATQQVISDAETALGTIAQTETEIGDVVSMLAEMSTPAAEAAHRAQSECSPAMGAVRAAIEALTTYAATLTTNHA